jgi:hypothetical protein
VIRRLFSVLVVISFVLLAASLAVWVRSYCDLDCLTHITSDRHSLLLLDRGRIIFKVQTCKDGAVRPSPEDAGWSYFRPDAPFEEEYQWWVWSLERTQLPDDAWYNGPGWDGGFAIWPIVLLSAVAPCIGLQRVWRRRRWAKSGRCRFCGYDLRATPDRCPECGATVKVSSP